jgi:hypothetical protein
MSPEKRERLEALIAQNLGIEGFTFANFIANPGEYGATINDAELLKIYIEQDKDDDAITSLFSNVSGPAASSDVPQVSVNEDGSIVIGAGLPSDNVRKVVVKDAAGNPVVDETGNPKTVDINLEQGIFPADNFVETFIQTLNRSDVYKIQEFAIDMGYIDEEDLGGEINGTLGIVTENFIYEVLNFANQQYEDWYEGSPARTTFIQDELDARNQGTIAFDVNSFFGGVDYRTNKYNSDQILSREIFSNAMDSFLKVRKSESDIADYKMDKEAAAQIRAANIKPDQLDLEEQLDELWNSLTGDKLSDSRKEELALGVMRKWTPYVEALIAQDKSIRAEEVMNTYVGTQAWEKMGAEQPMMGGYVTFEEVKPEFKVKDPRAEAVEELQAQAETQSELSDQAKLIADTQQEYLKWMMGRK